MYLLFDIGGTKTRVSLSADLKKIDKTKIIPTPKNFEEGVAVFAENFSGKKIKGVCGGIAGLLDKNKTKLINSPNLPLWKNKPFKKELEKIFKTPVYLENDADLAGLGEAVFGAGKGKKIVAYITVSTGVGGTRIVNKEIDKAIAGFEIGHQVIPCSMEKSLCQTLEDCISGTSFKKRYKKEPYEILDDKIWDEAAKNLAYGLNNTIVHWSPDVVILGGSMMKKIGISVEQTAFYLKGILKIFPELPVLKRAELGDKGGVYGCMVLLNQKL